MRCQDRASWIRAVSFPDGIAPGDSMGYLAELCKKLNIESVDPTATLTISQSFRMQGRGSSSALPLL